WLEKEKAKRAMVVYVLGWIITLIILMPVIYARRSLV
ncbi:MAG TPA: TIGR00341 family protein, partial [Chromatiales bacterium]|nr:TIGR00341 family protein [Chromatiales bacterium]HEX22774.1 TIGR00341 family protein [Chromatiales bacterium]